MSARSRAHALHIWGIGSLASTPIKVRLNGCGAATPSYMSPVSKSCWRWLSSAAASISKPICPRLRVRATSSSLRWERRPLPSGESNLAYLEAAARGIGAAMDSSRYRVVINKSTVPVGSGNLVGALIREGVNAKAPARLNSASRATLNSCAKDRRFTIRCFRIASSSAPKTERSLGVLRELYKPLAEQKFDTPPFAPRPERTRSASAGHHHSHKRGDDQVFGECISRDEDRFRE